MAPRMKSDFYQLLNVDASSTQDDIRRAFKKLAIIHHPDKNPKGLEEFKEIRKAYEVLSNNSQREFYDLMVQRERLELDLRQLFQQFGNALYDDLSYFATRHEGTTFTELSKNTVTDLVVSLEELYLGCTKNVVVNKQIICRACGGKGTQNTFCYQNEGLDPTLRDNFSIHSNWEGRQTLTDSSNNKCWICNGKQVIQQEKMYTVEVKKGSLEGHQKIFVYEGDQEPDKRPGDRIFTIKTADHPRFKREKCHDLLLKDSLDVNLGDALCGLKLPFTTIDGRNLTLMASPESVMLGENKMYVPYEGMPDVFSPMRKGNLIVTIKVQFPTKVTTSQAAILSEIFREDRPTFNQNIKECEIQPMRENPNLSFPLLCCPRKCLSDSFTDARISIFNRIMGNTSVPDITEQNSESDDDFEMVKENIVSSDYSEAETDLSSMEIIEDFEDLQETELFLLYQDINNSNNILHHHDLPITLREMYIGVEKPLPHQLRHITYCLGFKAHLSGETTQHYCSRCLGNCYTPISSIQVEKGCQDGEILLESVVVDAKCRPQGKVLFTANQKDHKYFVRRRNDLGIRLKLTLVEALTGFQKTIQRLDGTDLTIASSNGQIFEDNSIGVLENEGMPLKDNLKQHGRLFIKFTIEKPETLNQEQIDNFRSSYAIPVSSDTEIFAHQARLITL